MIISVRAKIDEKGINLGIMDDGFVEAFQKATGMIAQAAHVEWMRLAQTKLKTSRFDYLEGLNKNESFSARRYGDSTMYEIQLVGQMANNYEFGMPSFDMKTVRPGWLGGSKAKVGADGHKYIVIPFRHSVSSSTNIQYSGKAVKANLKQELKKTVKQYGLDKMIRTATGAVVEGPTTRVPKNADTHKYLQGLVRIQKGLSATNAAGLQRGSSQLMTFRIMSENSDADSWIHPGLPGANIMSEVEKYVDKELDRIIDIILEGR
jgi:hypothetical protein